MKWTTGWGGLGDGNIVTNSHSVVNSTAFHRALRMRDVSALRSAHGIMIRFYVHFFVAGPVWGGLDPSVGSYRLILNFKVHMSWPSASAESKLCLGNLINCPEARNYRTAPRLKQRKGEFLSPSRTRKKCSTFIFRSFAPHELAIKQNKKCQATGWELPRLKEFAERFFNHLAWTTAELSHPWSIKLHHYSDTVVNYQSGGWWNFEWK